jgi:aldehyde dehydrogenase (NAD+)
MAVVQPQVENPLREEILRVYEEQRANRWNIALTSAEERIEKLRRLNDAIFANREKLQQAIYNDYRKHPSETDITEIHPTAADIKHTIHHLKDWMRPQKVETPIALFGTQSEVRLEPKGLVLILSPWNYPFQLSMVPVVTAISAGNCVILKPSSKVPHTARFLKEFLSKVFEEDEVAVFEGDSSVADALLELRFDHIFFTGSPPIGKKVMAAAAKHLTPVTLELGGKSPAIVDETADIQKAAERIVWGKFINSGQTCVAPDYLLIHESRASDFISRSREVLASRYGKTPEEIEKSPYFCRLVSSQHLQGLKKTLEESVARGAKIEFGGYANPQERYLAPTLLSQVTPDSPIMEEEIFGPILPILTFRSIDEAIGLIRSKEKPLALYVFSENSKTVEKVLSHTTAGGSCVNAAVIHLGNSSLPFGGVGQSGMGNYHGIFGFRALSHERAVLRQGSIDLLRLFYPPYKPQLQKIIQFVTKHLS